jgi:serine-type D-Ala-D-Ala carboxypeptidase/endopeptidase
MKIWKKRIAFTIAVLVMTLISFIAINYLRIDNRVQLENEVERFNNTKRILRLDSTIVAADSITSYIEDLTTRANVHGLAISIINNNQLVYQKYFGVRNKQTDERFEPGTIWYGASLSKTILADVAVQLHEAGILHLDTPLFRYLKHPLPSYRTNTFQRLLGAKYIDYTDLGTDLRYKKITARMCLSHTTGFPNWRWLEPDGKLKINFEPGSRFNYSGEGMFLLQLVMEERVGKDFEELAFEKVFKPQGMKRSSYVWQRAYEGSYAVGHGVEGNFLGIPKSNTSNAAGSLSTTLEEYTSYFLQVLKQQESRYQMLVTPQIAIRSRQQFGPNALVDTDENNPIKLSYGLGFGLYETPFGKAFFKEGHLEGWQHYAVGFPRSGTAVVILSNSDNAEAIFTKIIEITTGNTYTPSYWEGYVPFEKK